MKTKIYILLKYVGFFKLSKFFFRDKLRIIAYHGFEINDETSVFSGPLFTKKSTLEQRMRYLKDHNFNVLNLSSALIILKKGTKLPNNSVVITVDDGWYSILSRADDIFSKFSYPYTIYVSSYYCKKEVPVLNVVLRYILLSCKEREIDLKLMDIPGLSGVYSFIGNNYKEEVSDILFKYFNKLETTENKLSFINKVAHIFEVDYSQIEAERYLSLLNMIEIKQLADKGVDIQLHTHRHRMPFDQNNGIEIEINDNKNCLINYVKNKLEHFCYPSGVYTQDCESLLKKIGITSATTCDNGFVTRKSNFYYLPRFLDGESVQQIEFEAEMCGVSEMFRRMRKILSQLWVKLSQKDSAA